MVLMMAAKHPRLFNAVSAWASMTNLTDWHAEMKSRGNADYFGSIEKALGFPTKNPQAFWLHSPVSEASSLKSVRIDLNAGITDGHHGTVSVTHSLKLFNAVADNKDRLSQIDFEMLASGNKALFSNPVEDDTYGNKRVLFRRSSENIRLTVFDGDHEMIPAAAIDWFSKQ